MKKLRKILWTLFKWGFIGVLFVVAFATGLWTWLCAGITVYALWRMLSGDEIWL